MGRRFAHQCFRRLARIDSQKKKAPIFEALGQIRANRVFSPICIQTRVIRVQFSLLSIFWKVDSQKKRFEARIASRESAQKIQFPVLPFLVFGKKAWKTTPQNQGFLIPTETLKSLEQKGNAPTKKKKEFRPRKKKTRNSKKNTRNGRTGCPAGPARHLDVAGQKLPRDNFCLSILLQLPSPQWEDNFCRETSRCLAGPSGWRKRPEIADFSKGKSKHDNHNELHI